MPFKQITESTNGTKVKQSCRVDNPSVLQNNTPSHWEQALKIFRPQMRFQQSKSPCTHQAQKKIDAAQSGPIGQGQEMMRSYQTETPIRQPSHRHKYLYIVLCSLIIPPMGGDIVSHMFWNLASASRQPEGGGQYISRTFLGKGSCNCTPL